MKMLEITQTMPPEVKDGRSPSYEGGLTGGKARISSADGG
jgi:hypothetical protein